VPFGDEPRVQAQVIPLSAAGSIPTAPVPQSAPVAEPTVQDDVEALRTRAMRPQRRAALNGNGAAEPRVVRKTKANALQVR